MTDGLLTLLARVDWLWLLRDIGGALAALQLELVKFGHRLDMVGLAERCRRGLALRIVSRHLLLVTTRGRWFGIAWYVATHSIDLGLDVAAEIFTLDVAD